MTTLLALFRRPDGGDEALADIRAGLCRDSISRSWSRRPACGRSAVQRVVQGLGGATDLVLITAMDFDDRAALDAGLASDAMRAGGRNLRDIAPGLSTLLVLESAADLVPVGFR